jgi:hypothetical protein
MIVGGPMRFILWLGKIGAVDGLQRRNSWCKKRGGSYIVRITVAIRLDDRIISLNRC